ncbi:hypothetical protein EVAR_88652_1 [Eumeta japonica]|uniref:TTF-type domain-containing protein n=1 Tax=Eumeta variegata TaxID=151549 RepID=A0A4C1Y7B7_EUMVA|nr:hypothetical protein EVAR_88652_1 [Eumeta japonica]
MLDSELILPQDYCIPSCKVEAPNTIATPSSVATGNVSYGIPSDIAQIGEPIEQVVLDTYPKQHNRAFVSDWFKRYKWLQYSVEKDAAFCYPCQQFLPHGSKQTSYTSTGFRNWKNATDSKTGFPKHEKSISHIQAMSMWEKLQRISTSSSVETLINQNFAWKLYFGRRKEQGLFQNLFEYTCMKDPNLNEVLTHTTKRNISFTRNSKSNNSSNGSSAIRYKDGVVNESLLMVKTTENLDAATFTELTLNTLTENNIDPSCMLSQCYDGPWLWPKILSTLQPADAALQARSAGLKDAITIIKQNIDENDEPFKSEYFETLDILIAELQRRFSDNDDLINSIASLDELDVDKMVPLKNLGLKIPSREEASVVKAYLSRNEDIMENTLQVLYRQREAFKDTYELCVCGDHRM